MPSPLTPSRPWALRGVRAPRPAALASLAALLALPAASVGAPTVPKVPSIDEVVQAEGFTPAPSQSEIYRPGAVLLPNAKGGHDVIVKDCVGVSPDVSVMAQSSIATSLSAGVSARLGVARGAAAAGVEKRLSFVDPEQRTIPLALLSPTEACVKGVANAAKLADLSGAIMLYDVLVAQVKNSVCTKADAGGKVVALGAAEAAALSECVVESDAQVPLGYKSVALGQVLAVAGAVVPVPAGGAGGGGLGGAGALPKQPAAAAGLKAELEGKLVACLKAEAAKVQAQAQADWAQLARLTVKADAAARATAQAQLEAFIGRYGAAQVRCKNDLGERVERVSVAEIEQARARLAAAAVEAPRAGLSGAAGDRVVGSSGYALRRVPAGTYTVGCTAGQGSACEADEKPARKVTLSRGVLVGEVEVTQGLYERLMGSNPSKLSACGSSCPVEQVSWFDAVKLANTLSAAEGLEACYAIKGDSVSWPKGPACLGYRLPTEAEWEVAARGGRDDTYAGGAALGVVAWFGDNSGDSSHPVGQKQANGYGVFDMSGNVWEWVWDWYHDRAYSEGAATDPTGPTLGTDRVNRGGSWSGDPKYARVAYRDGNAPRARGNNLGVRLVRTAP